MNRPVTIASNRVAPPHGERGLKQTTMSDFWQTTLDTLRLQMTAATFQAHLRDTWPISLGEDGLRVGVRTDLSRQWLEARLVGTVERALASVLERPVAVWYVVAEPPDDTPDERSVGSVVGASPQANGQAVEPAPSPGRAVAEADYLRAYSYVFDKSIRGTGYSQLAHYLVRFKMPLLGPAFHLWKLLDSLDSAEGRALKEISPNYWGRPVEFSFQQLAEKLGQAKSRFIHGEPDECNRSRDARLQEGLPLESPADCCLNPRFPLLRYKVHAAGNGLMCQHWRPGVLQVLHAYKLVRVQLRSSTGRTPQIQIWRMPGLLTPWQHAHLGPALQNEHLNWLREHHRLFGLAGLDEWERVGERWIEPLMPEYGSTGLTDNLSERETFRDFLADSVKNTNYLPCMGDIWLDDPNYLPCMGDNWERADG